MSSAIISPNRPSDTAVSSESLVPAESHRRTISSRVYLPALSIVAVAIVLVAIGLSSRWGGSGFAASITDQRVVVVGPVTIGILLLFMVVERLRAAQRRSSFSRG